MSDERSTQMVKALLDGKEDARAFMSAHRPSHSGCKVLLRNDLYGGDVSFIEALTARFPGLRVVLVDPTDADDEGLEDGTMWRVLCADSTKAREVDSWIDAEAGL